MTVYLQDEVIDLDAYLSCTASTAQVNFTGHTYSVILPQI